MLREAIEELKKHCLEHECDGCEFYDSEVEQCALALPPCEWEPAWTSELRPCPFCGGTAHIEKNSWMTEAVRDHIIYCEGCDSYFAIDDVDAKEEDLIEAWNRRAKE